jgi:hypothetical protein
VLAVREQLEVRVPQEQLEVRVPQEQLEVPEACFEAFQEKAKSESPRQLRRLIVR